MTIGIYSLYWEEEDLIYIGQSQNIERRFTEHLYKLKNNKHPNYKVQKAYTKYGKPTTNIIEICSIEFLNMLEICWTKEFNSLNNDCGLNIVEAGAVGWGVSSNASKYSKIQILKVFSLIIKSIEIDYIRSRTKVSKGAILDIMSGRTHIWLKEAYPTKYLEMSLKSKYLNTKAKQLNTTKILDIILIKDNIKYIVKSIPEFCTSIPELFLDYRNSTIGIQRVTRKSRLSYKGYRLYDPKL